ncbi:MAG: hypothetical protein M3301_07715, partial [Chloroflexota bacterium]|nr:hypothetical protein [Chloroflexota bacterium]
ADKAGVSRTMVSRLERGHVTTVRLDATRRICGALDARVELVLRWRGGELDRLLNAGHSAMHERMAIRFERMRDWIHAPEASFSIYGERGVIDILAWHPARRAVLVIELKTEIVDVQELIGSLDRKRRLAKRIAAERRWSADVVGCWLVIAEGMTNRRRVAAHATVLRAAFPEDGRGIRRWLREPLQPVAALSFLSDVHPRNRSEQANGRKRIRRVTGGGPTLD